MRRDGLRGGFGLVMCGAVALLTGCSGFFVPQTSTSGTSGGTTSGGDYIYIANQTTDTLSGFSIASGGLTSISTYALLSSLNPASVAVTIPNTYVYVGGLGAIVCYSIGSTGALTSVSGGGATAVGNFVSMDVSPDGKWLLALDSSSLNVYVYSINTSTGALSLNATTLYSVPGVGTAAQRQIRIAPNGAYVVAALGPGGDEVFTFNTTAGTLGTPLNLGLVAGFSDNAVLFDKTSSYVLFARGGTNTGTSLIASYSIATTGALTSVGTPIVSGDVPYSLLLDSTGSYVYSANRGSGSISGYTMAGGVLTALGSSPYASGSSTTALARDNSGKYVVAASSGGSSDVTLYSFDAVTSGRLDAVATAASGTDPAGSIAVAATH